MNRIEVERGQSRSFCSLLLNLFPSHLMPKANYKFIDFCAKLKTTQSPLIHNNNLIQAKQQMLPYRQFAFDSGA